MNPAVYQPAKRVVFEVADGRALLLNEPGTHVVTLNTVGTILWNEFTRPLSVEDLARALQARYPEEPLEQLTEDCATFVDELVSNGLLYAVC